LDTDDYPKAYTNYGNTKIQFSKASLNGNKIKSEVGIKFKDKK
jgi:pyruvate/2-oxoacid:ferredoxin oxidoreductase beta subunit